MAKVALLAFHGQGSQDPGYSDELKEELSRRLDAAFGEVTFREIYYQGILKDHQTRYWDEVEDGLGTYMAAADRFGVAVPTARGAYRVIKTLEALQ